MIIVFAQFKDPHGDKLYLVTLLMDQTIAHDGGAGVNA